MVGMIAASLVMGAAEFGMGLKSAHDQKKAAAKRARMLKDMEKKEFVFNSKQEFEDYKDNVFNNYKSSAVGIFNATKEYQNQVVRANMIASNMRTHNIASSSFEKDAQAQLSNQLQEVTKDILVKQDYTNKRLAEGYSTNMYQLELNRSKMENDISLSVESANARANESIVRGGIGFARSGLTAYKDYKTWGGGGSAKE